VLPGAMLPGAMLPGAYWPAVYPSSGIAPRDAALRDAARRAATCPGVVRRDVGRRRVACRGAARRAVVLRAVVLRGVDRQCGTGRGSLRSPAYLLYRLPALPSAGRRRVGRACAVPGSGVAPPSPRAPPHGRQRRACGRAGRWACGARVWGEGSSCRRSGSRGASRALERALCTSRAPDGVLRIVGDESGVVVIVRRLARRRVSRT
jgi:hypothetical protein